MSAVILAIAVVGGVGLFVGIFLGIAAIRFKVEVDEKEEAVLAAGSLQQSQREKHRSMPAR